MYRVVDAAASPRVMALTQAESPIFLIPVPALARLKA
jgi:hypothetical protein